MKIKGYVMAALLCIGGTPLFALDYTVKTVDAEGGERVFAIASGDEIRFGATGIEIANAAGTTALPWSDFEYIQFPPEGAGVGEMTVETTVETTGLRWQYRGGILSVSGLDGERTDFALYRLDGTRIMESSDFGGSVDVSTLAPGAYVARAGKDSFKFIKQ